MSSYLVFYLIGSFITGTCAAVNLWSQPPTVFQILLLEGSILIFTVSGTLLII